MSVITQAAARKSVSAVEAALRAGHAPLGVRTAPGEFGAIAIAAKKLAISPMTLRHRVAPGGLFERQFNLKVDWELAKPPRASAEAKVDPVQLRALSDRLALEKSARAEAERRAGQGESLRAAVFRLGTLPFEPPPFRAAKAAPGEKIAEAIVLPISDVHMGERIDLGAMGERNSYSVPIARARIERYFTAVIKLATTHWSGPKPCAIYVPLMGDLVSGEIHDELAKTNDLQSIPAVTAVAEALAAGIDRLCEAFPGIPIHVISLPGNHGRTTRKPESKGFVLNSYDTLAFWLIEAWFKGRPRRGLTFSAPESGDGILKIHGWTLLCTHGDRIGSRGGAGFVGVSATATRGMKRLIEDYAGDGIVVDQVIIGHFHTPIELEYGFVNGSFPGPSEYSRSGRMKSHTASQWMLSVHPHRGIARRWKIQVGDPNEGSIYKGRAV